MNKYSCVICSVAHFGAICRQTVLQYGFGQRTVNHYHIWFDMRPGTNDLEFAEALNAFLGHLKKLGTIADWTIGRRMLGLTTVKIGDWHVDIQVNDLGQLQAAFDVMTPRSGEEEKLHAQVWSKAQNLNYALYRDFPDDNREQ